MGLLAKITSQNSEEKTLFLSFMGGGEAGTADVRTNVFPAEWFPQSAVQLTWPHLQTDWRDMMDEVLTCYIRLAFEIARRQTLIVVAPSVRDVRLLLQSKLPVAAFSRISFVECSTNDIWARDHAFLTTLKHGVPQLNDFRFNGWGEKYPASLDNTINKVLFDSGLLHGNYADHNDFVLEGGSVESDGRGCFLTTSRCLLSPKRNPHYDQQALERYFQDVLLADRILWLHHGCLVGDDTDGHIDTLARFCPGDTIVYVQCTDKEDEQYEELLQMEQELRTFVTRGGKSYTLVPIPLPDPIYDGTERLPATYANFLIMNEAVLMPTYGQPKDEVARAVIQEIFPHREVVGIDCRVLIRQHGSLHCATMQYPVGVCRT